MDLEAHPKSLPFADFNNMYELLYVSSNFGDEFNINLSCTQLNIYLNWRSTQLKLVMVMIALSVSVL